MSLLPETSVFIGFILACAAIVAVPGPTVTVIIANSMRHGSRAGLLNVAGTQIGLIMMVLIVATGLEVITTTLAFLFDWLRLIGAAYLIWLGFRLLTADGTMAVGQRQRPGGSFFLQGLFVIWSNPKALLFYGAFIPQFVTPGEGAAAQTVILGLVFMVVATVLDSAYALAAGKAGSLLTRRNIRATEIVGGSFLLGGGLWLGLSQGMSRS